MDTTTSLKMTTLAIQSLFSYVEDENLAAIKLHLDKFREVDSRSEVRPCGDAAPCAVLSGCVHN